MSQFYFLCILFFSAISQFSFAESPIFMNTLPKSGSMYINHTLEKNLNIKLRKITRSRHHIIEEKLIDFLKSKDFIQTHIKASLETIELLKKHNVKFIVHVRDPRQATLSWTHHLLQPQQNRKAITPHTPKGYFSWTFKKQLDFQIKTFFPKAVKWIQDWLEVYQEGVLDMKIMKFTHLKNNPESYFDEVLEFFDIPTHQFSLSLPTKIKGINHYRKGEVDEWRKVLPLEQQEKLSAMIPQELFDFFGWPK